MAKQAGGAMADHFEVAVRLCGRQVAGQDAQQQNKALRLGPFAGFYLLF